VTVHLAQPVVGNPTVNIAVFGAFVLLTLVVVFRVGRGNRTASDYYTGGSVFSGTQNGAALAGDYLSAAAFLGIAGAIAVFGYDGLLYAIGAFVGWLVALLLIAEWLRNTGRFTMGDVLSFRMRQRPVRTAAATSTLMISLIYLIAQIAGAGGLIALLLGITDRGQQALIIAAVGGLMIVYVLVGGMKGTTWVQIIKANLLLVTGLVLAAWILGRVGFNVSELLGSAVQNSPRGGEGILAPGLLYGQTETSKIDFISLSLAAVLGPASLPHILMRFYTVPDATQARRSVVWAIWLIGGFFLMVLVIGYGATALVGPEAILAAPGSTNSAAPLLAFRLGGELLLGIVAAVAFATILAVVAGLTITASASFAHDVYANVVKKGQVGPAEEVRVARCTALVVGLLAVGGSIVANGQNIAVLVTLAFAVAASSNMAPLLYSLFWKRFNTTGALWSMYGGMTTAVLLIVFSPAVSGTPSAMLPSLDFAFFPLSNPGIVSIPLSFLLGALGAFLGPRDPDGERRFAEMEVRALTGAGSAGAVRRVGRARPPAPPVVAVRPVRPPVPAGSPMVAGHAMSWQSVAPAPAPTGGPGGPVGPVVRGTEPGPTR
jgi:cation/acetate symporter